MVTCSDYFPESRHYSETIVAAQAAVAGLLQRYFLEFAAGGIGGWSPAVDADYWPAAGAEAGWIERQLGG